MLDLVMAIEKTFGVQFSEEDFAVENFANINAIIELISKYQTAS